jgi:hypothetical protein
MLCNDAEIKNMGQDDSLDQLYNVQNCIKISYKQSGRAYSFSTTLFCVGDGPRPVHLLARDKHQPRHPLLARQERQDRDSRRKVALEERRDHQEVAAELSF